MSEPCQPMRKRVYLVLAGLFLGAAGLATWEGMRQHPPEPVYEGRPLSYWIRQPRVIQVNGRLRATDLPKFDSNAVPFLVACLERCENPLSRFYFSAWSELPAWIKPCLPRPMRSDVVLVNALGALGSIGPAAKPAIPVLVRELKEDKAVAIRCFATQALWQFAGEDLTAQAALVNAMQDPDSSVRQSAAMALTEAGAKGREVVRAARKCLSDRDPTVRRLAAYLLLRIAPTALDEPDDASPEARAKTNAPDL